MTAANPVLELTRRERLEEAPYGSYQDRIDLYEAFEQRPILAADLDPSTINQASVRLLTGANRNFVLSGTNAANAGSVIDIDGGIALSTAGADNDQVIISPAAAINSVDQTPWAKVEWEPEHEIIFEAMLELPSIANVLVHAGFGLTANLDLTTDADQVKFQFSTEGATSTANWTATYSIAGTDTETDLTVAAAADTLYRLKLIVTSARLPEFSQDRTKYVTGTALTAGVNLIPFVGIQALTAAAKTLKVRSLRCSRLHG